MGTKAIPAVSIIALLAFTWSAAPAQAAPDSELSGKHVLVIPVSDAGQNGAKLDKAVNAAVSATGATAVSAKVRKSDIAAITGCEADSSDCYDQIALTLGVDHMLFGKVTPQDGGDVVSLTLVGGGKAPRTVEIKLETGATRDRAFQAAVKRFLGHKPELVAAPVPVTQPAPPESKSTLELSRVKRSSWALLGGGLAAMGTGTVLLLLASSKQSDVDSAPTDTAADLDHLADLENSGKSLTVWGNVFLIGGGIAAVTGAVLATRQAKSKTESQRMTVSPAQVRGGFGISLGGRF